MPRDIDRSGSGFSTEQINNARIISQVGRSMGMSSRDILIGLMTALQESGLRNLHYGDRDSQGLFQQRPSAGWGTVAQVTDPRYAATKFFQHLGRIKNRNGMELWQAAQKVQISAFPRAYAKHESNARNILSMIGSAAGPQGQIDPLKGAFMDTGPTLADQYALQGQSGMLEASPVDNPMQSAMDKILDDGIGGPKKPGEQSQEQATLGVDSADEAIDWSKWTPQDMLFDTGAGHQGGPLDFASLAGGSAKGLRSAAINMAKSFIGKPYVFGASGPSSFDCSGLVQYVLRQMGVKGVPRLAYQQANWGQQTSIKNIGAGDLIFWGNSRRSQGNHIAFYLGNGMILEAPRPGLSVRIRKLGAWDKDDNAVGVKLNY